MTEEDEAFEAIEKAQGWRKRQIEQQLGQPIYFKPRREWVGLSWEEIDDCFKITPDQYLPAQIYKRIEKKLKEKNHV